MSADEAESDEPAAAPPERLLARLRADPLRAPEHIALAASEQHAPAAARWAGRRRHVYGTNPRQLGEMARRRHATLASVEGAATGVGGFITLVPDLVGLAWIQSRLVFFVAAAYGYDPHDRMRPAELLVINGLYPDVASARAALDGVGTTIAETYVGSKLTRDEALVKRLLLFVGKSTAMKAGRLIPGFAIFFNSVSNRRDTNRVARRAIKFYGG
jgi:hypothetical protein